MSYINKINLISSLFILLILLVHLDECFSFKYLDYNLTLLVIGAKEGEKEIIPWIYSDAGEVLRELAEISAVKRGATALDPIIRGLSGDRINVLIDGAKVEGACPSRMDAPTSHATMQMVEKIEVIKGPFSVRYGLCSPGGVIIFHEREPIFTPSLKFKGELISGFETASKGYFNNLLLESSSSNWGIMTQGSRFEFDDYKSAKGRLKDSSYRGYDYSVKTAFSPWHNHRIGFGVKFKLFNDAFFPALPMDAIYDDTKIMNFNYTGKEIASFLRKINSSFNYSKVDHLMDNRHKPTFQAKWAKSHIHSSSLNGKIEGVSNDFNGTKFIIGADFYGHQKDGTRKILVHSSGKETIQVIYPNASIRDAGLFLDTSIQTTSKINLSGGVRMDWIQSKADKTTAQFQNFYQGKDLRKSDFYPSGNIGAIYNGNEAFKAHLSIGCGIRTPNILERYSCFFMNPVNGYDYLGNPLLKAEKSIACEAGVEKRYTKFSWNLKLFDNEIYDYILPKVEPDLEPQTPGAKGVMRYENRGRARIMGFAGEGLFSFSNYWKSGMRLSYLWGENLSINKPLPDISPLEVNLTIGYEKPNKYWALFSSRIVNKQNRFSLTNDENKTPGFTVFNLSVGARAFDHIEAILSIENLLDKYYHEHTNRMDLPEPGRNIKLSIKLALD